MYPCKSLPVCCVVKRCDLMHVLPIVKFFAMTVLWTQREKLRCKAILIIDFQVLLIIGYSRLNRIGK